MSSALKPGDTAAEQERWGFKTKTTGYIKGETPVQDDVPTFVTVKPITMTISSCVCGDRME